MNSATTGRNRRLSLPQIVRTPVTRSNRPGTALSPCTEQRRLSVSVQLTQSSSVRPRPVTDDDDDDDEGGCHGDGAAVLLSEIHNCRNQMCQLVTSVSQLEVSIIIVELRYVDGLKVCLSAGLTKRCG